MLYVGLKTHENWFWPGLCPRPHWGAYTAPPDSLQISSWWEGASCPLPRTSHCFSCLGLIPNASSLLTTFHCCRIRMHVYYLHLDSDIPGFQWRCRRQVSTYHYSADSEVNHTHTALHIKHQYYANIAIERAIYNRLTIKHPFQQVYKQLSIIFATNISNCLARNHKDVVNKYTIQVSQ